MRMLVHILAAAAVLAGSAPSHAQSLAESFKGKQFRFVLGAAPDRIMTSGRAS